MDRPVSREFTENEGFHYTNQPLGEINHRLQLMHLGELNLAVHAVHCRVPALALAPMVEKPMIGMAPCRRY